MKINVIVVNTAAKSGGALTILRQFIKSISKYSSPNIQYHIFVSEDLKEYQTNNINIIHIPNGNSYVKRIFKEGIFIKNWCKENNICPNLMISLQNIGINGFENIPQIIYLHQPIPFRRDLRWSLFRSDERKYWFYKHIYYKLIKSWTKKDCYFIVQTNWMKEALSKQSKLNKEKIFLIRPDIDDVDLNSVNERHLENGYINMFYPTSNVKYKNYELLFSVMKKLNTNNIKYKLYITLDEKFVSSILQEDPKKIGIVCLGNINYKDVLEYYKSVDIMLFPSYLETFGLPLIEAASFGLPIVTSDLSYSKEVLNGYQGVEFANYNSVDDWVNKVEKVKLKKYIGQYKKDRYSGWDKLFGIIMNLINEN